MNEAAIRAGCNAADAHLTCSYPDCKCKQLPVAIQAALNSVTPASLMGVEREDVARAAQEAADRITRSLAISGWTPRRSNIESARNDLLKIAESLALLPKHTGQPVEGWRGPLITKIIQEVAELPDRTSPEDQPQMMLVSCDELESILENLIPSEFALFPAPASQPLVEGQWQPIETALKEPMDGYAYGPTLLLVVDGQLGVGFWDYDFKKFYVEYPECGSQPTRWMLPPIVAEQETKP